MRLRNTGGSAGEEVMASRTVWATGLMSGGMWVLNRELCENGFQVFSQDGDGERSAAL